MTHMPSPDSFVADVLEAANRACRRIPPAWPLQATVAVNPYLGFTAERLVDVAARMERIGGPRPLMPREWYAAKIASGDVTDPDIDVAIAVHGLSATLDAAQVRKLVGAAGLMRAVIPTIGDLAAAEGLTEFGTLARDRISAFAEAWFDAGQAMWRPADAAGAFAAWREFAMHDLVPEFSGLKSFCRRVTALPIAAADAVAESLVALGVTSDAAESYCHQLLLRLGGWAEAARLPGWKAEQEGREDDTLLALLAASLAFEVALLDRASKPTRLKWQESCRRYAESVVPSDTLLAEAILQEAIEEAGRRKLAARLSGNRSTNPVGKTSLKAYFCIDVRSEVFRRALESVAPEIETGGFAGFFGVGASHRRFGSVMPEHRLPVLLSPRICTEAGSPEDKGGRLKSQIRARAKRALQRFSQAAVASFAYVEAAGLGYAAGLARSTVKRVTRWQADAQPQVLPALGLEDRITTAATILNAMSLTANFPKTVLLVGHGALVENNPFASALACGACGGHAGDVNARLLAAILNDHETRQGLVARGIAIPDNTLFVPAIHDTTSDAVTLFEQDLPQGPAQSLDTVKAWLAKATIIARTERAARLPGAATEASLGSRGGDWSELRPEWGLAGCQAFIAAPRALTRGLELDGRTFLHDYDWQADRSFGVLELILTAPVVVASWISLQYYGSTVAPQAHGSGNKLLHNVVGGIGVLEGNGGPLRTGLPWQSVHDGERLVHEPLRLTVLVAAPETAISAILEKHPDVRTLFDNGWLALATMDDSGHLRARYTASGWVDTMI
jgi:uncharacterized protein YbcC (UPF0753/DUF2309 family)